jgi:hypothetical protein
MWPQHSVLQDRAAAAAAQQQQQQQQPATLRLMAAVQELLVLKVLALEAHTIALQASGLTL